MRNDGEAIRQKPEPSLYGKVVGVVKYRYRGLFAHRFTTVSIIGKTSGSASACVNVVRWLRGGLTSIDRRLVRPDATLIQLLRAIARSSGLECG